MRKTKAIMLCTLIALFGATALAQARDATAPEQSSPAEASRPNIPAIQGDQSTREHRSDSREPRHANRDRSRKHHDEARERHDENGRDGQHD